MKVLLTGSHFSPAQAVIEKLAILEGVKLVYIGRRFTREGDTAKSPESQIFPKLGVKFIPITAGKLNRYLSFDSIISFLKTPIGFIEAFYYLLRQQPDIIVSFGGFTGLPVVICGWFLSVPSIIHEQSLKLGFANFISSFFADKVAVSFEGFEAPAFLNSKKIVVTGNPIRKEMLGESTPSKEIKSFISSLKSDTPLLLVTAGNQGSHKINLLVEDILTKLTKDIAVIHQTGDSKFGDYDNLKKHQSKNYLVKKWIDASDLSYIMDHADLAVSRAGINTLIELALKSVPSLMVPIPVGSEQKNNAKFFSQIGLGEAIEEKKLTPDIFLEKINELLGRAKSLKKTAEKAKEKVVLDADKRLVQEILILDNLIKNPGLNFR